MGRARNIPGSRPPTEPSASVIPSTKPDVYTAHENTLARKNNKPILPPNSGPRARLIISVSHISQGNNIQSLLHPFTLIT